MERVDENHVAAVPGIGDAFQEFSGGGIVSAHHKEASKVTVLGIRGEMQGLMNLTRDRAGTHEVFQLGGGRGVVEQVLHDPLNLSQWLRKSNLIPKLQDLEP